MPGLPYCALIRGSPHPENTVVKYTNSRDWVCSHIVVVKVGRRRVLGLGSLPWHSRSTFQTSRLRFSARYLGKFKAHATVSSVQGDGQCGRAEQGSLSIKTLSFALLLQQNQITFQLHIASKSPMTQSHLARSTIVSYSTSPRR
jgi:hypothetical protein